ncbi:MAG TPA: DUF6328 family protein [Rhodopila sp.]|nr:DUF6328 family protein [Rhodopila sp.]
MPLSAKVKTALDETRTLILGAQILLGFQFQSAFRPRFQELPAHGMVSLGCALGLLLATVGLLIAPSAFHRIAERGASTGRTQVVAGRCAEVALLPFAAALGLDLSVALEQVTGAFTAGWVTGAVSAVLAAAGWFGTGRIMRRNQGAAERREAETERDAREAAPLHARIEQMLTEARVILPGGQALLGFQLAIVLSSAFEKLPMLSRLIHGVSLLSVALSVILLITPAALHRIVWSGEDSEDFLRIGGRITSAALVPLALGMTGEAYVVFTRISGSWAVGVAAAGVVLLCLLVLWFVWPVVTRERQRLPVLQG